MAKTIVKDKLYELLQGTNIDPGKAFYSPQEVAKSGWMDEGALTQKLGGGSIPHCHKNFGRWRIPRAGWIWMLEQHETVQDARFVKTG